MEIRETKNDIPEGMRTQLVTLLNERLAELLDLKLQVKQAHWNIKGPSFIALHLLFDELAEDVDEYADLIAERAVQLGGIALGTVQSISATSKLDSYPTTPIQWKEHVLWLSTAIAAVASSVRQSVNWADEIGDAGTTDIFTEVSRGLDVWLWKVEAHGHE